MLKQPTSTAVALLEQCPPISDLRSPSLIGDPGNATIDRSVLRTDVIRRSRTCAPNARAENQRVENQTKHARLVAAILRDEVRLQGASDYTSLREAVKVRCVRQLRLRDYSAIVDEAFRLVESNTPLGLASSLARRPRRLVELPPVRDPFVSRDYAVRFLARVRAKVGAAGGVRVMASGEQLPTAPAAHERRVREQVDAIRRQVVVPVRRPLRDRLEEIFAA